MLKFHRNEKNFQSITMRSYDSLLIYMTGMGMTVLITDMYDWYWYDCIMTGMYKARDV